MSTTRPRPPSLAALLADGKSIALVTDAGTPALSDPGFRLVRACRRRGLPVVPVPGPSALTAVLSASGLPTNGFLFVGFLPAKSAARIAFLEKYRDFDYTLALYESCHRIDKFAAEIVEKLGPARVICIAKEVTKIPRNLPRRPRRRRAGPPRQNQPERRIRRADRPTNSPASRISPIHE